MFLCYLIGMKLRRPNDTLSRRPNDTFGVHSLIQSVIDVVTKSLKVHGRLIANPRPSKIIRKTESSGPQPGL